ncbi:hypothetical protein Fmac_012093 [Flemingia macrophylla]|uniref:Uncharacterized protein n=1 Tax=Flemingia macrophylla TaxID=520843 RepID=A0ABD1MPA8_9FABA
MHDGEENGNNSLRQSKREKPLVPLSCSIKKLKTNPRKKSKSYPCQGVETRGTQSRRTHAEDSHLFSMQNRAQYRLRVNFLKLWKTSCRESSYPMPLVTSRVVSTFSFAIVQEAE